MKVAAVTLVTTVVIASVASAPCISGGRDVAAAVAAKSRDLIEDDGTRRRVTYRFPINYLHVNDEDLSVDRMTRFLEYHQPGSQMQPVRHADDLFSLIFRLGIDRIQQLKHRHRPRKPRRKQRESQRKPHKDKHTQNTSQIGPQPHILNDPEINVSGSLSGGLVVVLPSGGETTESPSSYIYRL